MTCATGVVVVVVGVLPATCGAWPGVVAVVVPVDRFGGGALTGPDGVEALAFLRKQGKYADSARPHLALLDLNLPKKNGHEVLEEIKFDPDLRGIPVVVLTTSQSDSDIRRAYELGANCCITKPTDLMSFIRVMESIQSIWLTAARLPAD